MEDADEAQGTSLPGFPSRGDGHPLPGIMLGPVTANGNGFLYEHVPAGSESAVNVAVQDVVVSDASAGKPLCILRPCIVGTKMLCNTFPCELFGCSWVCVALSCCGSRNSDAITSTPTFCW